MYKKLHLKFLLLLAMMLMGAGDMKAQKVLSVKSPTTIGYESQSNTLDVTASGFSFEDYEKSNFEWYRSNNPNDIVMEKPYDWLTLQFSKENSEIIYTVTENPLSVSRTAYFKLYLYNTISDEIFSGMITITQEGHRVVTLSPKNVTLASHNKDEKGFVNVEANFELEDTYNYSIEIVPISTDWLEASYNKQNHQIEYIATKSNPYYDESRLIRSLKLIVIDNNVSTWSDSVTITQPRNTDPVVLVSPQNNTLGFGPGSGEVDIVTHNFSLDNDTECQYEWFDIDGGTIIQKPDWIDLQFDKENAKIIYTVTGNTSNESRTAYFKLQLQRGNLAISSEMISVTQNYSPTSVLSITPSQTVLESNAATTGTLTATIYNFPYQSLERQYHWYTDATREQQYSTTQGVGPDWIVLKTSEDKKTITYTITENTSSQPRSAYFVYELYNSYNYSNDVWSNLVTITQPGAGSTITIAQDCTDGTKCYGTYSSPFAFVVPESLTVAKVGVDEDGKLVVTPYTTGATVPANTGVMVSADQGGNYVVTNEFNATGTSVPDVANLLRPSGDGGITADAMAAADANCKYYRLTMHNGTQIGFWWGAAEGGAFNLAANKAYLAVPNSNTSTMGFTFDGDKATAIEAIAKEQGTTDKTMYNLHGQRVTSPTKGLYIVNGKKVIIK